MLIDDVSHELRTPLAVVITNADVLLANPEPTLEGLSSGLQRSRTTARRLATTIENLLVDARSTARTIERQPTSLRQLVREVADELAILADQQHVTLLVRGDDQVRCALDRASVHRAVLNLIDNAVRHAPPHTRVEIDVTNDAGTATVTVTDHGLGNAPQDQAHVFDRFWRSDPAKGTGLGLAIVAHVATAHGGSVPLTSPGPTGTGCEFALSLPATSTNR